jgi:hypothetical protein
MAQALLAFLLFIPLAGCANRAPNLEPLVQASDTTLTCDQIIAETKINNQKISDLAAEQGWKVGYSERGRWRCWSCDMASLVWSGLAKRCWQRGTGSFSTE